MRLYVISNEMCSLLSESAGETHRAVSRVQLTDEACIEMHLCFCQEKEMAECHENQVKTKWT